MSSQLGFSVFSGAVSSPSGFCVISVSVSCALCSGDASGLCHFSSMLFSPYLMPLCSGAKGLLYGYQVLLLLPLPEPLPLALAASFVCSALAPVLLLEPPEPLPPPQ